MRKYHAIPKSAYDALLEQYPGVGTTQKEAFTLAEDLQEQLSNDGESVPVVLIEEVGVLQSAEIVRKVKRSFTASRSIERKPKETGEQDSDNSGESTSEDSTPRKRGRKPKSETPTE